MVIRYVKFLKKIPTNALECTNVDSIYGNYRGYYNIKLQSCTQVHLLVFLNSLYEFIS